MSDNPQPKKKSKLKKILIVTLGVLLVAGGAGGGVLYATGGSLVSRHAVPHEEDPNLPQLVARDGVSDYAVSAARARAQRGQIDPRVFQATYVPLENVFTSNLQGGSAFVQIGLGISTYYDQSVVENVSRHEMAIRSAILMTLSEQDPARITTTQGKQALKIALKNAINDVLTNREGFGGIDEVYFTSFVTQ